MQTPPFLCTKYTYRVFVLLVAVATSGIVQVTMKLTKRTATLLLVIGVYMLFTWTTRLYTWYANDLQESPYAALIHFPIVLISLGIGAYLTYLGVKGRRAASGSI